MAMRVVWGLGVVLVASALCIGVFVLALAPAEPVSTSGAQGSNEQQQALAAARASAQQKPAKRGRLIRPDDNSSLERYKGGLGFSEQLPPEMQNHTFLFIAGAHHSGTTLLDMILCSHPSISCLDNHGRKQDEGQHLQSVYPPAGTYGGEEEYGFHQEAHLTETSSLLTNANRLRIFSSWSMYWTDTSRPVLLEKSPPNVIKMRFLERMFTADATRFVVLMRHPLGVLRAHLSRMTDKHRKTCCADRCKKMVEHWLHLHHIAAQDIPEIKHVRYFKLEHFLQGGEGNAAAMLAKLDAFLSIPPGEHIFFRDHESLPAKAKNHIKEGSEERAREREMLKDRQRKVALGADSDMSAEERKALVEEMLRRGVAVIVSEDEMKQQMNTTEWQEEVLRTERILKRIKEREERKARKKNMQQEEQQQQQEEHSPSKRESRSRNGRRSLASVLQPSGITQRRSLKEFRGTREKVEIFLGTAYNWVPLWESLVKETPAECEGMISELEPRVRQYGYSLRDLTFVGDAPEPFEAIRI